MFWGWGLESEVLRPEEVSTLEATHAHRFGIAAFDVTPAPRAEEIRLRAPRVTPPVSLREVCSTDHYQRLLHSYGRSFFDSARIFARDFANPPDVVAFPRDEREIVAVLDWCDSVNAVAIPWGGGSSVVRGAQPRQAFHRFRRDPRHHPRSLDAGAAAPHLSRRDLRAFQGILPGGGVRASHQPVASVSSQYATARCRRGAGERRRRRQAFDSGADFRIRRPAAGGEPAARARDCARKRGRVRRTGAQY